MNLPADVLIALIVWGTLVGAGVIVLEASLSVLNFGVRLGTASWGSMLAQSWGTLVPRGVTQPMPVTTTRLLMV